MHLTVAVHASLECRKNFFAVNKLAEDGLVAVEVTSSAEGDCELGAAGVLSVVGHSELAPLDVPHLEILVHQTQSEGAQILFSNASTRDPEA